MNLCGMVGGIVENLEAFSGTSSTRRTDHDFAAQFNAVLESIAQGGMSRLDLARKLGISRATLHRRCQTVFGCPPAKLSSNGNCSVRHVCWNAVRPP